jgi:hypothetical protein
MSAGNLRAGCVSPDNPRTITVSQLTVMPRCGDCRRAVGTQKSGAAVLLAQIHPHEGAKADPAWSHRLTGPDGEPIGTLTLIRTAGGWSMQDFVHWTATWDMVGLGAKAPSAGASPQLEAPAGEALADLLVAALLDVSTLPRGYIT